MTSFATIRDRMNSTGIGYAGLDGVWWRPATEPVRLPTQAYETLHEVARALFLFFDTISTFYHTSTNQSLAVRCLLDYKASRHLSDQTNTPLLPVLAVRPDFQVQRTANGRYTFYATELEICPSAYGFAHAMQIGYGLRPDLIDAFSAILQGRTLLFAGSHEWSEFIFEQLAFCRALTANNLSPMQKAYVLFDRPLHQLAKEIISGQRWQPPIFGIPDKPTTWNDDIYQRLSLHGLEPYLWNPDDVWPASVDDAVVVRFGYLDNFALEHHQQFHQWSLYGATVLNPASHIFDSKVLLAALHLPNVRRRLASIDRNALVVLDECLPETVLLTEEVLPRLIAEQNAWVVKYAGFDRGNQAWGGRSLHIGEQNSRASWTHLLHNLLALPWPVVAQRIVPSLRMDISYFDETNTQHQLRSGSTRLRTFFLRHPQQPEHIFVSGAHFTVADGVKVAESTTAVQTPVHFVDLS